MGSPDSRSEAHPHELARRLKRSSVALAIAAFGVALGLVSQNVVGATNATTQQATVPGSEYFGSAGSQPVPLTTGSANGVPVVRSGAS